LLGKRKRLSNKQRKQLIADDRFVDNLKTVEEMLSHGGSKDQCFIEADLSSIARSLLKHSSSIKAPAKRSSTLSKQIKASGCDFSETQIRLISFFSLIFSHRQ